MLEASDNSDDLARPTTTTTARLFCKRDIAGTIFVIGCFVGSTFASAWMTLSPISATSRLIDIPAESHCQQPDKGVELVQQQQQQDEEQTITQPHAILQQYKTWHSVDTLRTETTAQLQQRRFAVAYYSCPLQAGNRLHHFLNSLLLAIITNRTVLYQYLDAPTCRYHQAVQTQILWQDQKICKAANQQADCDQVLERAAWVPSYAELSTTLRWNANASEILTIVDYWNVHSYSRAPGWEQKRFPLLNVTTTAKIDEMKEPLIAFPELVNKDAALSRPLHRNDVLATASARERTAELFAEGTEFLYGMLFKDVFQFKFADLEKDKTPMSLQRDEPNGPTETKLTPSFSIAMHSRHRRGEDGSNIQKEKRCFDQILKVPKETGHACHVCLMSDRPLTMETLTHWLIGQYNCTIITADLGNDKGGSFLDEHGPTAGVSFFRELDLCQHFTDGIIGTGGGSSSTSLLEEWMDYNRKMQQLRQSSVNETALVRKEVHKCWL